MMRARRNVEKIADISRFSLIIVYFEVSFQKTDCTVRIICIPSFRFPSHLFSEGDYCVICLCVRPLSKNAIAGRTNQENINHTTDCATSNRSKIVIFIAVVIVEKLMILLAVDQHGVFGVCCGHTMAPFSVFE